MAATNVMNAESSQKALIKIIESLCFLARQGLPTRGHTDIDSNMHQLLKLRAKDSEVLSKWHQRKQKWLGHDIENEMLQIMGHAVLREISLLVKENKYFSLIVDETSDVSNKEQVSATTC